MERILKEELARKNEEVHRLKNNDQETLRLSATRGADEIESLEAEIRALKSVVDKQKGEIKDMLAQKEEQEKFAKGAMEEVAVWQKEAVGLGLQLDRLKAKNTDMSTLEDQLQSAQKQADEYLTLLLQAQEQLGKSESTEKDIDIKNRTIHELEQNLEVLHASHEKLTTQHKHLKEALDMAETRLQGQQAVPNDPYHGHDDSKVTITMREKEELFRLRKAARDTSETALSSELQEARAAKERLQKLVDVQRTQLETYSDTQPVTQGSTEQLERENRILVETRSLESNERRREQRTMASVIHELAFRLHTLQMERSRLLETHLVDVETLKSAILEQKHLDGSRS
ncbi:MAG: uncharacterized protein KVP18_003602 [Porospora cf. gigantea A]|uniref:uncharacterized protein n=2 Tax=Porospora cf. gigantea A TaxID=2853593 RepID=UPI00355AAA38|nr:MAG: hypothetical protein KVP18_003602 [Porospora cf. gigantea A]